MPSVKTVPKSNVFNKCVLAILVVPQADYASKQHGPAYTGSIPIKAASGKLPEAIPGEDGYVADEDD